MVEPQCMEMVTEMPGGWHKHRCPWPAKFRVITRNKDIVVCGAHVRKWRKRNSWTDDSVAIKELGEQ